MIKLELTEQEVELVTGILTDFLDFLYTNDFHRTYDHRTYDQVNQLVNKIDAQAKGVQFGEPERETLSDGG